MHLKRLITSFLRFDMIQCNGRYKMMLNPSYSFSESTHTHTHMQVMNMNAIKITGNKNEYACVMFLLVKTII